MVRMQGLESRRRKRSQQLAIFQKFESISEPPKLVPITFGQDIFDEGTRAQLLCSVSAGDTPLTLTWSFHGNNISSDSGILTSNLGMMTSILMINSVDHGHRGSYTCLAKNKAGVTSSTAELKVNG